MTPLSTALAAGRIAFGTGLMLAPAAFSRPWLGSRARDPLTAVVVRGLGVRDLALGIGGLASLHRADVGRARWWYAAQGLSDGVDLLATLSAGSRIGRRRRLLVAAVATGSAAVGFATAIEDPSPSRGAIASAPQSYQDM